MGRTLAVAVLLGSSLASAHDVSVDLGVNGSRQVSSEPCVTADGGVSNPTCNSRAGSASASVSGSYDFNERWSAWLGFSYVRELPTKSGQAGVDQTSSSGGNVFLLTAGAMWLPSDHFSLMAGGSFSPTTTQRTAMTIQLDPEVVSALQQPAGTTANFVMRSDNGSWGANLSGAYTTGGLSRFESTVDASAVVTGFGVYQQAELGASARAAAIRAACRNNPRDLCIVVNGVTDRLIQARLGAGYTATLFDDLDLGLDAAFFLYSKDPTMTGYYPSMVLGRELGNGVPAAPLLFTVRPSVAYRFTRLTLRLSYQLGAYVAGLGSNHLISLRATIKVSELFRLSVSGSLQSDRDQSGPSSVGGGVVVGALFVF